MQAGSASLPSYGSEGEEGAIIQSSEDHLILCCKPALPEAPESSPIVRVCNAFQSVIFAALEASGVHASDVDMVSMHGTGTSLGDPVEVAALSAIHATGA
eukprot:scaffold212600_cov18-Tisochrysis_lutea.AAC.1